MLAVVCVGPDSVEEGTLLFHHRRKCDLQADLMTPEINNVGLGSNSSYQDKGLEMHPVTFRGSFP